MSFHKKPKTINPDDVDPSVFYYDEVYDDMKSEETTRKADSKNSRNTAEEGSKYIKGLLETAELRKSEKEVRKFKRYAKDRADAEADGLINKTDVYITPAYKKRLEEINKIDKDRKRRIEDEEDRKLNIHKKRDGIKEVHHKVVITENCDKPSDERFSTSGPSHRVSNGEPKKQLRTSDDRKEYLKEVLAKRTVGEKLLEAQERYRRRKDLSQTSII